MNVPSAFANVQECFVCAVVFFFFVRLFFIFAMDKAGRREKGIADTMLIILRW